MEYGHVVFMSKEIGLNCFLSWLLFLSAPRLVQQFSFLPFMADSDMITTLFFKANASFVDLLEIGDINFHCYFFVSHFFHSEFENRVSLLF